MIIKYAIKEKKEKENSIQNSKQRQAKDQAQEPTL